MYKKRNRLLIILNLTFYQLALLNPGKLPLLDSIEIPVEFLPYCSPKLPTFLGLTTQSIMFSVPKVGSSVIVTFPTKDKYHPEYAMSSPTLRNISTFFQDSTYPNAYGFIDPEGNYMRVNESSTPANNEMLFNCVGTTINTNNATVNNITTSLTNNAESIANSATMDITDNCNVREITASQQMDFTAPVINLNALVNISTGVSVVVATVDGRFLEFTNGILTNVS